MAVEEDIVLTLASGVGQLGTAAVQLGPTIIFVVTALAAAYITIKIIQRLLGKLLAKVDFNKDIEHLFMRASGWVMWFFAIAWLVGSLGLEEVFTSLLAVGALGGLAVAMAVKDSLKDAVSGMLLLKDRHFDLGDTIDAAGIKGKVFDVGLLRTRIKVGDGVIAIVPNSKIHSSGWKLLEREECEDILKKAPGNILKKTECIIKGAKSKALKKGN